LKDVFDVNSLDLVKVSKSFGFDAPPYVDLPVSHKPAVKARENYKGAGYQKNGNKTRKFTKPKKPQKYGD
jgi:ATP-dependent RNA helicase DDX18/HAS1